MMSKHVQPEVLPPEIMTKFKFLFDKGSQRGELLTGLISVEDLRQQAQLHRAAIDKHRDEVTPAWIAQAHALH